MAGTSHLVTGAGSGIGRVVAERLLERGDEVVLVARSAERAHDLRADHPGATVLVADLADAAEVESLAGSLPDALDSLVHAAGVVELGPVGRAERRGLAGAARGQPGRRPRC